MSNNKYACVVRTYINDIAEAGYITEDSFSVFDTDTCGVNSSIIYGADTIEIDYFEYATQREALREYLELLQLYGSEYRAVEI